MKRLITRSAAASVALAVMVAAVSCRKEQHNPPPPPRTARFVIYTDQDLHDDNHSNIFELRVQSLPLSFPVKYLVDTFLSPIKVSEIPDKAHALVFEKVIPPGHEKDAFKLTILDEMEDVGVFWRIDSMGIHETQHTLEWNFH